MLAGEFAQQTGQRCLSFINGVDRTHCDDGAIRVEQHGHMRESGRRRVINDGGEIGVCHRKLSNDCFRDVSKSAIIIKLNLKAGC